MTAPTSKLCSCCNTKSVFFFEDKHGKVMCLSCLREHELQRCPKCKEFKTIRAPWGLTREHNNACCNDCIKDCKQCENCNRYVPELVDGPYESHICSNCLTRETSICSECGELVWRRGIRIYENRVFCGDCRDRLFRECHRCNNTFRKEDFREDNGRLYCRTCYPLRHLIIHSHSYRPTSWNIFGDKTKERIFFGVELEVECRNIDDTLKIVGIEKGDRLVKHDGSIRHGFEIVSSPCTLKYHQRRFDWRTLCSRLTKLGCNSALTSTCGLHIHITNLFSKAEKLRFATFIYHNIDFAKVLCRRNPNNYALYPQNIWGRLNEQEVAGDRYELLNWTNADTVEFRLPKGTLNHHIILATIEFCSAAINYSMIRSARQLRREKIFPFLTWLEEDKVNRSKYTHLISFCHKNADKINHPERKVTYKYTDQPRRRRTVRVEQVPPPPTFARNVRAVYTERPAQESTEPVAGYTASQPGRPIVISPWASRDPQQIERSIQRAYMDYIRATSGPGIIGLNLETPENSNE